MNVLITGGTGSLGSFIAKKWYAAGHKITILSRDPHKQAALAKRLPNAAFVLSDICNQTEVEKACVGQDVLIHAAALKQVEWGEYFPAEFARVNVQGTQIVADAWMTTHPVVFPHHRALLISSDKAVNALNAYGACKKVAEAVFRKSNLSVLRYGNVVDSEGSFLDVWKDTFETEKVIKVRQPSPTRFFLTLRMATDLVDEALGLDVQGIFVPHNLKSFSIEEVAKKISKYVIHEPLLPYEKIHEVLVAEGEIAEPISDNLSIVEPGWSVVPRCFSSRQAEGMNADEFLEEVVWKS